VSPRACPPSASSSSVPKWLVVFCTWWCKCSAAIMHIAFFHLFCNTGTTDVLYFPSSILMSLF
jgi:hypothetical protein